MSVTDLTFIHRFVDGDRARPLLLLHGTGGDENDLVPLTQHVAPGAALLSPRGQVSEHGMPRFFRRFGEGRFDHDDVRARADDLVAFVTEARERYGLAAPVAVGFSNGANIAAAVLYRHPDALAGAVLIRAVEPLPETPVAIPGTRVLLLSGSLDPIMPVASAKALATALTGAGASVDHRLLPAGHQLTNADLALTADWLASRSAT